MCINNRKLHGSSSLDIIDELTEKSQEFASYSADDMVVLTKEMMNQFRSKEVEWSNIDDWRGEESKVFQLDENQIVKPQIKQVMSMMLSDFLQNCLTRYEYEAGTNASKPKFMENVRTEVQVSDQKSISIYGPTPNGIPNEKFDVYTLPEDENNEDNAGTSLQDSTTSGKGVCLVLGAGNQPFLSLFDSLNRMILCKEVVLLKHHPLRPHLMGPYGIILQPLIERGFFQQIQDEGIDSTKKLLSHPKVGHVHITGSVATDKAVRATLAKANPSHSQEKIDAMVTAELGCVTPYIITNSTYTDNELVHAARLIVYFKKINGGCNCLNSQVVVMPKEWHQKEAFRNALKDELLRQPNTPTYYPGSRERAKQLISSYKKENVTTVHCEKSASSVYNDDVTIVECRTPGDEDYNDTALRQEAFGPILAFVELPSRDYSADEYLPKVAVPFVNEQVFGSLSCVILSPASYDDKPQLSHAVQDLQYGTIGINSGSASGYMSTFNGAVWGAHPLALNRESGAGFVGNVYNIPRVAKTVVSGMKLASAPVYDGAKLPPPILLDALSTMKCSHSTLQGVFRIIFMVWKRAFFGFWSSFFPFLFPKSKK